MMAILDPVLSQDPDCSFKAKFPKQWDLSADKTFKIDETDHSQLTVQVMDVTDWADDDAIILSAGTLTQTLFAFGPAFYSTRRYSDTVDLDWVTVDESDTIFTEFLDIQFLEDH